MSEQISPERWQKLLEKCGFRFKLSSSENPHYWLSPNGQPIRRLPPPTLDNLFKWVVPKMLDEFRKLYAVDLPSAEVRLFQRWLKERDKNAQLTFAEALFLACEKAMEGK